ncbi:MAG: hypothetical protein A2X52_20730 [Candidatus Rokubacteria bacterium GWC2_70_16]|nr:MAG: hypothetical protein A2X52_20730 [Candidatus Rokubacteria bacterium GWC2_70_16]OGL16710.1 MAG: hypothetical protein A3K12_02055 [Candidatus Rokubacteria bacterium RIFCSPLOWO2_12_FULL_71_19]
MTRSLPADDRAACLASLDAALATGVMPDLAGVSDASLDAALRALVRGRAAAAAPLIARLAREAPGKALRKAARRALYRLEQSGISAPRVAGDPAGPPPIVRRQPERAVAAWLSGIDGSGSRAAWILFQGGLGGALTLCSLILNDEAGILDVAGGPITRKRLEAELASLRESQKLPWVESDPARACALVDEALAAHAGAGTDPPPGFSRWRVLFESRPGSGGAPPDPAPAPEADPTLVERSAELMHLPELAGWFVDPAAIQGDAVALLEMKDSRLVVPDQVKAERETAIVDGAIAKAFPGGARGRWARRLREMAWVFRATGREEPAALALAAAAALGDESRAVGSIPLVRAMAARGLELAGEVALGRVKAAEVSRAPSPRDQ